MNALVGYIAFDKSENHSEKNRQYLNTVIKAFPSRFAKNKTVEENGFGIAGDFVTFQGKDSSQLFFNGEIYNQQKAENPVSPAGVELLNGQFIFIEVNKESGDVHLINDQMGIRQLYYYHGKDVFLFGTEIKFLLAHPDCPKEIDWQSSLQRPHPSTVLTTFKSYNAWFKDIQLMAEGCILTVDTKKRKTGISPYYDHSRFQNHDVGADRRSSADVMEEYIQLLEDAVKIRIKNEQLTYSFLSGGLDSSAIVALCAKHNPVETFSIVTQTTWLENTTMFCHDLARDLKFKNTQFLVPTHELFFKPGLWQKLVWRMESPVNHNDALTKTFLHYAISKTNSKVKGIFTGTGSDQLNGGLVKWIVNEVGNTEQNWEHFISAIRDVENEKLIMRSAGDLWKMKHLVNRDYLASISGEKTEPNSWMFYVDRSLHGELFSLCWDEVRAASYHEHEMRFPFLDFRFIEFIAGIPQHLHKDLFFDKPILRNPIGKLLPDYILNKSKAPANIPDYDYRPKLFKTFTTGINNMVEEAFGNVNEPHPVINKAALVKSIKRLQNEQDIGEWNRVMTIVNLGLLEKLAGKTEQDMNIESYLDQPLEIAFEDIEKTKIFVTERLGIRNAELKLDSPLLFAEDCALLSDKINNKFFLSKKTELVFEIEDQYKDWLSFLQKIDNKRSVQQILDELKIDFAVIEEFLRMSIDEKLLSTMEILQEA